MLRGKELIFLDCSVPSLFFLYSFQFVNTGITVCDITLIDSMLLFLCLYNSLSNQMNWVVSHCKKKQMFFQKKNPVLVKTAVIY